MSAPMPSLGGEPVGVDSSVSASAIVAGTSGGCDPPFCQSLIP